MRKKSQAAKNGGNAELSTEAAPESPTSASEGPEGTNPSLKKVKSLLARRSSKKNVNWYSVRRSERIQNYTPRSFKPQSVIEEITLSESDEEDELRTEKEKSLIPPDQENDRPELMMGEKEFEEKIDYISKLLEAHGHTLDSIKTEVTKRSFSTESEPTPDMKYRNMYIASQKKIEELAEENRVLTQKLENTVGRFEAKSPKGTVELVKERLGSVTRIPGESKRTCLSRENSRVKYKNGNRDAFEMLEKLKDVISISNGLRVSESTQAELDKVTSLEAGSVPPSSKRKKLSK